MIIDMFDDKVYGFCLACKNWNVYRINENTMGCVDCECEMGFGIRVDHFPIREDTTHISPPEKIAIVINSSWVPWYYEGCTCAASGHPPCSWCMSLSEEEVEILDNGGQEAVLEYRK
ncbi:hypothetical protein LCGC14_0932760 [marine sediment metagenome]|uniref:Uncharacterized protein n=1 Tax=marine sediment metagenome TaxID=412755 RepID=A0A0F9NS21_9ZZZZ